MFVRPLANEASALVFFSRRTDMPYRYHSSLAQLNFNSSNTYEVSNLPPAGLQVFLGGVAGSGAHLYVAPPQASDPGSSGRSPRGAAGMQGCGWYPSLHWCFQALQTELLCITKAWALRLRASPYWSVLGGTFLRLSVGWGYHHCLVWTTAGFANGEVVGGVGLPLLWGILEAHHRQAEVQGFLPSDGGSVQLFL